MTHFCGSSEACRGCWRSLLPATGAAAISSYAGQLLPITQALVGDAGRSCTILPWHNRFPQIAVLVIFALAGLPLSLLAFHWGVRWAKIAGTLSHF